VHSCRTACPHSEWLADRSARRSALSSGGSPRADGLLAHLQSFGGHEIEIRFVNLPPKPSGAAEPL
jgi:hypothetical protein